VKHLPLPADAGDAAVERLCRAPAWRPHRDIWIDANARYRAGHGDPWEVAHVVFDPDMRENLLALWTARRANPPIAEIRSADGLKSCPMCGSSQRGSVDHYLPRTKFPEFAILFENLVPACPSCNSDEKGAAYIGEHQPERFIHPYYDVWADQPLWRTQLSGHMAAATFDPVPEPQLDDAIEPIVRYHLANVLGRSWQWHNRNLWAGLPRVVARRVAYLGAMSEQAVRAEIEARLADATDLDGPNSWDAALMRGVAAHDGAIAYLAEAAEAAI
jgi:hypothetical protein